MKNASAQVISVIAIVIILAGLACNISEGSVTPTAESVDPVVVMTLTATESIAATVAAVVDTPVPEEILPEADVFAPDPLGPAWSSMAFRKDTCYDMDVLFTAEDASTDFCLDENVLLTPVNAGLITGVANRTAPSLNECRAAELMGDPVALLSDAYLCFQTNSGAYGFMVMRTNSMLSNGYIVFDAYLFP